MVYATLLYRVLCCKLV